MSDDVGVRLDQLDRSTDEQRELLARELSDVSQRMFRIGGPAALMASAVALTEASAMAMPLEAVPQFFGLLTQAVVDGARASGNTVSFEFLAAPKMPREGSVH